MGRIPSPCSRVPWLTSGSPSSSRLTSSASSPVLIDSLHRPVRACCLATQARRPCGSGAPAPRADFTGRTFTGELSEEQYDWVLEYERRDQRIREWENAQSALTHQRPRHCRVRLGTARLRSRGVAK
jgi:hypothetical protein